MKRLSLMRAPALALILLAVSSMSPAYGESLPPVPATPHESAIAVRARTDIGNIEFAVFRSDMLTNAKVGIIERGSWFCGGPTPIYLKKEWIEGIKVDTEQVIAKALAGAGYPKFEPSESTFGVDGGKSPDFKLGVTLKDYQQNICVDGQTLSGGIYYKFKWEVYSNAQQKVVYTQTTDGSVQTAVKLPFKKVSDGAIENAVNNLLASPGFVAALTRGDAATTPAAPQAQPGGGTLGLSGSAPAAGGMVKNMSALKKAVALIENDKERGTGFYIDKAGYLLTASHVVGEAKFVSVRLADDSTLIGEVIRNNPARDVALIKTKEVNFAPLPIRSKAVAAGEEVYAIGSPNGRLDGTVTRGIVSAQRQVDGNPFLQSDVAVTFGNSGGPLLDASGAVIGMTSFGDKQYRSANFFVPIMDGLKKLDTEVR